MNFSLCTKEKKCQPVIFMWISKMKSFYYYTIYINSFRPVSLSLSTWQVNKNNKPRGPDKRSLKCEQIHTNDVCKRPVCIQGQNGKLR